MSPVGLILIYHRVAEDPIDPMAPVRLARELCAYLEILRKKGFKTVHVSELADTRPRAPRSAEDRRRDVRRRISRQSRCRSTDP